MAEQNKLADAQRRLKVLRAQERAQNLRSGGVRTAGVAPGSVAVQPIQAAPGAEQGMAWSDVGQGIIANVGPSAVQFGKDIIEPVMHPVETAKALGNLGLGTVQKLIPGEQEAEQHADAVGRFFADRYGGIENLKQTMASDPVGFLADASTILTGGAGLAARAPMAAGKVAGVAGRIVGDTPPVGRLPGDIPDVQLGHVPSPGTGPAGPSLGDVPMIAAGGEGGPMMGRAVSVVDDPNAPRMGDVPPPPPPPMEGVPAIRADARPGGGPEVSPGAAPDAAPAGPSFADVLKAAGDATDPVKLAAKGLSLLGRGAGRGGSEVLGWLTGAGGDAVRQAARTGAMGGYLGERFRGAMRGEVDLTEVVDEAKGALNVLRHERSLAYRNDMSALAKDKTVLSFDGIDAALQRVENVGKYKGQATSPSTAAVRAQIQEVVAEWKALDAAEYHTPEGLDALKQRVGDILDAQEIGKRPYKVASEVYKAIRGEIAAQAPEYAKTMRSYERATSTIRDIEKSLSIGKNASAETAVRKLQGIMRNDVSSAYGRRAEFARKLEEAGAEALFETMAGSQMSSVLPRGMATLGGPGSIGIGAVATSPAALAALPLASPRVVGEAVHGGARLAAPGMRAAEEVIGRLPPDAGLSAFQAGRAASVSDDTELRRRMEAGADYLLELAAGR